VEESKAEKVEKEKQIAEMRREFEEKKKLREKSIR
jgi:hypothetical protein